MSVPFDVVTRNPNPPPFTYQQKEDLERLWKIQTLNSQDDGNVSDRIKPISNDCMSYMIRLHGFIFAFLKKHSGAQNHHQTTNKEENESSRYLKDTLQESSLEPFYSTFVERSEEREANHGGTIRLNGEKLVIMLNHENFLFELNEYEYKGQFRSDNRSCVNNCYGAYLYHHPLDALAALNVAMGLAVISLWRIRNHSFSGAETTEGNANDASKVGQFLDSCRINVRFVHVSPQLPMADIKTGLLKKLIAVKGHVVKARPRRLRVSTADFGCQKCGAIVHYIFEKGRFSLPSKCSNLNCRSRSFKLIRQTARYTNIQELRLQESQEESTSHAGRTPRQFEVELDHDLIDSCRPGDIILLACYVDAINSAIAAGRSGKRAQETSTYKLFLQGHSVTTLSESNNRVRGKLGSQSTTEGGSQTTYTHQQLINITQLCHADHRCLSMVERRSFPFDLLVQSICPSIIGHHAVKAGILLCLLGGTPPVSEQMDRGNTIRSNSHILIVGDPGMGKSQMLLAATQLASRSVYVGGNTASTTGLTVTLTKEEGGETGIEAGALVLADQGVACIDELDKCKHLDGLLEAMEQQCVSIAKAGVVATLPARCSIIAAANPKHGSYDMGKSVAENINMARPVLSRFDLVFILRDRVEKDQDRLVSRNIMNLYRKSNSIEKAELNTGFDRLTNELYSKANGEDYHSPITEKNAMEKNRIPFEKRLQWVAGFNEALPAGLVRDYIAYAREYCKPKLTQEAAVILREYYMTLRYPTDGRRRRDSVPITTRQLEALIRLSQARAKACLREFVLEEDALDVVEMLKRSVDQVHTDEFGIIDRSRAGARGLSNRKLRKEFTKELYKIVGIGAECTYDDLLRVSNRVNCPLSDFNTIIDEMRNNGTLIKKSNMKYQIVS
mmetsp:Transcript_25749/g.60369  ORF Transcript_25749/g.60369 Transcript_25749/m.60369 type:complete len:900 (+) Transcript_25749:68-2767(+)